MIIYISLYSFFNPESEIKTDHIKETGMKNVLSVALVFVFALTLASFAGEKKVEIKVDGMTCNACVNKVKASLEKTDGVKSAQVSLENNSAIVVYDDSKTDESSLKKAINAIGFKAVDCKADVGKKGGCCDKAKASCDDKKE